MFLLKPRQKTEEQIKLGEYRKFLRVMGLSSFKLNLHLDGEKLTLDEIAQRIVKYGNSLDQNLVEKNMHFIINRIYPVKRDNSDSSLQNYYYCYEFEKDGDGKYKLSYCDRSAHMLNLSELSFKK